MKRYGNDENYEDGEIYAEHDNYVWRWSRKKNCKRAKNYGRVKIIEG